jgi:DNA-binding CsgD family transcriptional regulator
MTLKELNAIEIIKMVLGDKRMPVKSEEELALLLKKRMTKKELEVLNAKVKGITQEDVMASLNIDAARHETLVRGAIKKLKNESVHGDFFYDKIRISEEN